MEHANPYAPPEARLEDPRGRGTLIAQFPRFSAWWVLLLSVATLALYLGYWLYTRSRLLGKLAPAYSVPPTVVYAGAVIFVGNFAIGFVLALLYPDDRAMELVANVVNIFGQLVFLVWLFWFRNRMNALARAEGLEGRWLSALLTLFFSAIYLQYKINEAIDAEKDRAAGAPDATIPPG